MEEEKTTHWKALMLNRDQSKYGTLAEIGAGQEVARWFFKVGGASGTIAKSMSAYDMQFSDAIYGPSPRYLSRLRLITMLDHEFELLNERLGSSRGGETNFFAYANTVKAIGYQGGSNFNGWVGVRFQTHPGGPANDVILHVWMHDQSNFSQQEALGILGVNLIDACFRYVDEPEKFLTSLMDNIGPGRIEIDMILFSGPNVGHINNQLMNLLLVARNFTSSVIFSTNNYVHQASEILYRQPVLVGRGRFRPITRVNEMMMKSAMDVFARTVNSNRPPIELMEISLHNLLHDSNYDFSDYLARIEIMNALGLTVMVSNRPEFHRLAKHLRRNTPKPVGIVLGVSLLQEIFSEKYYEELEGGLLEGVGRLFKRDLQLFVYPVRDPKTNKILTLADLDLDPGLKLLVQHLKDNQFLIEVPVRPDQVYSISSLDVSRMILEGNADWKKWVNPRAVELIESRGYFQSM